MRNNVKPNVSVYIYTGIFSSLSSLGDSLGNLLTFQSHKQTKYFKTVYFVKGFTILYRFVKPRIIGGNAVPITRLLLQLAKTAPNRRWDSLAAALNICVVTTQLVTDVFDLGLVTLNLADSSVADFTTSVETRTCATHTFLFVHCSSHQTLRFR